MTRLRRALRITTLVVLLLVSLALLALVGTQTAWFKDWLRRYVSREAERYLNAQLVITRLDGNLFTGIELEGVSLVQGRKTVVAIKDVGLDYNALDLLSGGLVLDAIRINEPRLLLERGRDGWNLATLVKEQASEADREGPGSPLRIGSIGISNGEIAIVDSTAAPADAVRLPHSIGRIDLKGAFDYRPVDFTIDIAHLSFRTSEPDVALNSLSGRVLVSGDDVRVERLAVRTAETSLSLQGTVNDYTTTPAFDLALSSDRFTPRELGGLVPALASVQVAPAFELTAKGPLAALNATLNLRSEAGSVRARLRADVDGPARGVSGTLGVVDLDLSRIAATLPASDVTASSELDVTLDEALALRGTAKIDVAPTSVAGYRLNSLALRTSVDGTRARIEGSARAYGAHVTTAGTVVPPLSGRALAVDVSGRATGLDLRRLPRSTGAPALTTRLNARYAVRMEGPATQGSLVFDESTVEGARIAAGSRAEARLEGSRASYGVTATVRELDPQGLGRALRVPALQDPRLEGRLTATVDVQGSGRTLPTLNARAHVQVPHASLLGGTIERTTLDARVAKGAVDATLISAFSDLDPARAASRPDLAGAVSGTLDAAVSLPDVTKPALETTTGRATLSLATSRVSEHTLDKAQASVELANGVLNIETLDVASPLATLGASGSVALTPEGRSTLTYKASVPDLAAAAAIAGVRDVGGAATIEGSVTGNRADLQTKGTLAGGNLRYGTTARSVDTDVSFDVGVTNLDPATVRANAKVKASLVEVAGRSIREISLDTRYANREASFDARVAETEARTLEASGVVALPPSRVDLRLDRLALRAPDVSWTTAGPARITYAEDQIDVDDLRIESGAQRLSVSGRVALGTGGTRSIPADRPLRLRAEQIDLAAVDRLAALGRGLAGQLNAAVTLSGTLEAPVAEGTVSVREGAVGEFTYQAFEASLRHDATAARVDARLDRQPEWLTIKGTLPTIQAFRDGSVARTAPFDVRLESSDIDLAVLQTVTTALRDVKGRLRANVHATGSVSAPVVDGTIGVTGGAFVVAATETPFTGLEADVAFSSDRVDVRRLSLADAEGHPLTVSGSVGLSLAERSLRRVDLRAKAEDFRLLDGRLGELSVDVDLDVKGELQGLQAQGTVAVRDGRIEIDRVLEQVRPAPPAAAPSAASTPASTAVSTSPSVATSTVPPAAAPAESKPATPSLVDTVAVDVRVRVPNNLVLRGDDVKMGAQGMSLGDLNMTLGGDLRATKRPGGTPLVVGSIRTVRGFYEFQGRRFDLRRDGTVSFKGPNPANPQLDVTAIRDISGIEARVRVHGEAQRPELELASTPPLDQADILSLIIFNRPINDLGEGEKTSLAQRAGSLAGGFVAAPVAEALRDALDVDLLEITPVAGDEGGPSVSIGNQIGERVFVKVRQQFGATEVTQLVLEYELSELLRLETNVSQGGQTSRSTGRRAERGGADLVFVIKY